MHGVTLSHQPLDEILVRMHHATPIPQHKFWIPNSTQITKLYIRKKNWWKGDEVSEGRVNRILFHIQNSVRVGKKPYPLIVLYQYIGTNCHFSDCKKNKISFFFIFDTRNGFPISEIVENHICCFFVETSIGSHH